MLIRPINENYSPFGTCETIPMHPLTRPRERLSSVHPSPPVGARELSHLFLSPRPHWGEGTGLQLNFFTPQGVQGGCLSVASRTEPSNRTPPQPKGCYPPQGGIFRTPTPGFESAHEFFQFPS